MKQFFPLLKYLGFFLLLYFVIFGLFSLPSVARVSANIYRAPTQSILQTIYPKAYLKLEPDKSTNPDPNMIRAVYSSKEEVRRQTELAKQQGATRLSMNATEYELYFHLFFTTFFVFLITLIWITPIDWKSKLWAIFFGAILFYLFTVLKIAIFLLDLFNKSSFQMYKLGDFGSNFIEGFSHLLKSLGFSSFIVVLIWVLVAFRKSNWKNALDQIVKN